MMWREDDCRRGAPRPAGLASASGGTPLSRLLLALLLIAPLAGCLVGPDFKSPSAPVSAGWLEMGDPAVHTGHREIARWWRLFGDPTLDRLVETAYQQNLTLVSAGTRVLQARAELGVAIGGFYPQSQQATGALSYNRLSHSDPSLLPRLQIGDFWRDSLGAAVAWELDFWGKFRRGIESADAAYLASIASYDDVLVTLLGDVATTYIGIRTLETQLAIARDNIVKQKKALQIAEFRYHGGVATKLDVYQAENVLGQTEATVPQLTAQLHQGEDALRVLLGLPAQRIDDLLRGPKTIPVPPEDVVVGIPADLVRRRPDIRAAELAAAAQSAQIGFAKADLYPAFSLFGTFGTQATNIGRNQLGNLVTGQAITFAFGPSFQWNILNYGQITNTVRVQDAKLQGLLVDYQNTVLKAQQQVEDALSGFLEGGRQVEDLRRSVAAANAALVLAFLQYQLGTRDFTTVLTAEQNLYTAQNDLALAEGNTATALASLYRALGGGWQIREDSDFVPAATRQEMTTRTNWGNLLPPVGKPAPPAPGLPNPAEVSSKPRPPEW